MLGMVMIEKTGRNFFYEVPEERDLVHRVKNGDRQAFSGIVTLYRKRIFRLAYGFFHDRDDAMEIVQETFIRIFEKIDDFDEHTHFRNWIYRISLNLCIDYYRKFKKKNQNQENLYRIFQHQAKITINPEDHMFILKQKQILRRSISLLPKRQKLIFVLKHYGHYKYKEIADILNISIGGVKSSHHRSINKIKKVFVGMR